MNKISTFIKKSLIILTVLLVTLFVIRSSKVFADTPFKITINYQKDDKIVSKSVAYDSDLKSAILADYNDLEGGDFSGWTPTTLIDDIYENAFAGWELVSINGNQITGTYFYPDNDYIYSNDEPFVNYDFDESTVVVFKPIYGKRIYLRDKYNFININNVFGNDVATAKINWDTSKIYSYSLEEANVDETDNIKNVGSSFDNPVSHIEDAIKLLGTTGGEIVTVNHYTFKNLDTYYDYFDGLKKSGSYYVDFGRNITHGVVTYTGLDYGFDPSEKGNETEKSHDKENLSETNFNTHYKNAHWYCLNTRGNEGKNSHTFNFYFYSDTVLENLNIIGYREIYKIDESRYNNQVYFYSASNRRFVMMDTFDSYKRETSSKQGGRNTTNWGYSSIKLENSTETYVPVSTKGMAYLQLYSGFNSKNNGNDNVYVTLYGNTKDGSYPDGFYHYSIVMNSSKSSSTTIIPAAIINNIHVYMDNITMNSDFMGINQGLNNTVDCNFYGVYLNDFENASSAGFVSSVYNTKSATIKDLVFKIDGSDSGQSLRSTYIGGAIETTGEQISSVTIENTNVIVSNNAYIESLYGGGNQFAISTTIINDLVMDINGGTILNLYGGCQGGTITANKIDINVNSGKIRNLYGGGAGGFVTSYVSNSPLNVESYEYSDDYKYFVKENTPTIIEAISIGLIQQTIKFENSSASYDVLTFQYVYPNGEDYELHKYYNTSQYICVSNALVTTTSGINININGGKILSNIYGGGLNGAVNSDININVTNGEVSGNIYGGGSGQNTTFYAKEYLGKGSFYNELANYGIDIIYTSNENALNSQKFAALLENSTDTIYQNQIEFLNSIGYEQEKIALYSKKIIQGSDLEKIDILTSDKQGNQYIEIYSDVIETLGSITGDTDLLVSGGTIGGNIFGGSDGSVAKIEGDTNINVTDGTISGYVYGGGNVASVTGNSNVNISKVTLSDVYGGGNNGSISGNTNVNITENATITNVYAGSNQANVGKDTNLIISNSTITNAYGGNNITGTIAGTLNTTISSGTITNLYGGGNAADTSSNTIVKINGGTLTNVYGGGNAADVNASNITVDASNETTNDEYKITNIYGGGYSGDITTNSNIVVDNGTIAYLYGGGYSGDILGSTKVDINDGSINTIYGGGFQGAVNNSTTITFDNATVQSIYGGGFQGDALSTVIEINSGTVEKSIYGGGYSGDILSSTSIDIDGGLINTIYGGGFQGAVENSAIITFDNATAQSIYGGGLEGNVSITTIEINSGTVEKSIYGGGYAGDVTNSNITLNSGEIKESVYGGGYAGDVLEDVVINVDGINVLGSVYGGGFEGNVTNSTNITVKKGNISENIYGGGYAGTVDNTEVLIEESEANQIQIGKNVFGGGKGVSATVYTNTKVTINLMLDMTVLEASVSTEAITSGETKVEVEFIEPYSKINGSVYGGGDLGQVGVGAIDTSNNTASITKAGTTYVEIKNGYIGGNVFGGGSGVPTEEKYELKMGTIFGSTRALVNGGYIEGNLYGGGTQSRVYFSNKNDNTIKYATNVNIIEIDKKIVIKGSVFGGGDRGNSATTNASVPTTIGDVLVTITGQVKDGGSDIYFVNGGVYGDGNLCLVNGTRTINITNFQKGEATKNLKTFYSLQRADIVNLDNTDIVLLGAIDLVEEGDTTIYSINRIDELNLQNGSTVKLDQIVKYLGQITSDFEFVDNDGTQTRPFINHGNNGSNSYGDYENNITKPLTSEEINRYRANSYNTNKNVICVANGLYLEIKNDKNEYGKVEGLFSLELLIANPGEGGGFVYADIETSTGDFICEVTFQDTTKYMDVIDNVGGYKNGSYTYYLWFIQGSTINYKVGITGYIGSDEETYLETVVIPEHNVSLSYVLNSITINEIFKAAIENGRYTLVANSVELVDNQIALELMIGSESIGFVVYDSNTKTFKVSVTERTDDKNIEGYKGNVNQLLTNVIKTNIQVSQLNSQVSLILHKSKEVNAETTNMQAVIELDICEYDVNTGHTTTTKYSGTSTLIYQIGFSIVRLVPVQNIYTGANKNYTGVSTSTDIMITMGSSFTVEYQTRYIPSAFPNTDTSTMTWSLSLKGYSYYMDSLGNYMTLDANGDCVSISSTLSLYGVDSTKIAVTQNANGEYQYVHDDKIITFELQNKTSTTKLPVGTKITMIDLSKTPTYYYYIYQGTEEEIDLKDFYLMGTKTTLKASGSIASFESLYRGEKDVQEASRITERIIFIFDFGQVIKDNYSNVIDDICEGNIMLQHKYNGVDIMDYVKSDTLNDITSYTRSTPKVANYKVNLVATGIGKFDVEFKEESYVENNPAQIEVIIKEDDTYTNTQLSNGTIGVKIETKNNDDLPDGIEFSYNGIFLPKYGNKYIIIPVLNYGTYTVDIVNVLGTIETNDNVAEYEASICYLPDEQYYNETILVNTVVKDVNIRCEIVEEEKISLDVILDSQYILLEETKEINAKVYLKTEGSKEVEFEAYMITPNGKIITNQITTKELLGSVNGTDAILNLDENIVHGLYQLKFTYEDKVVLINIIIM